MKKTVEGDRCHSCGIKFDAGDFYHYASEKDLYLCKICYEKKDGTCTKSAWCGDYVPNGLVDDVFTIQDIKKVTASPYDTQVGGGHYSQFVIQPTEFLIKNKVPFTEGNIIKYALRHKHKNKVEDLKKIIHYVKCLAFTEYGETL